MINHSHITTGLLVWMAIVHLGCSRADQAPPPGQPEPPMVTELPKSNAQQPATVPAVPTAQREKAKDSTPDPGETAKAAPFRPPYAERQDPFRRPDFKRNITAKREERPGVSEVVLKGFANAGTVRALLAIDGKIAAVEEGEQRADVQVIAIAPPQVILQRGRVRWTETLYEVK